MKRVVVYVHGLWFTGHEAYFLRHGLARELAAEERAFSYHSVSASLAQNAAALGEFLTGIDAAELHLVGHSLGGVVILKLFDDPPRLPPGRIVLLGSPVNGSRAAQGLARLPWGTVLLGQTMREQAMPSHPRQWRGRRELGVIAGTNSLGLGRLVAGFEEPNDGAVSVAETRIEGSADSIELAVSHSGMVFSALVVQQAAAFLRDGRFER